MDGGQRDGRLSLCHGSCHTLPPSVIKSIFSRLPSFQALSSVSFQLHQYADIVLKSGAKVKSICILNYSSGGPVQVHVTTLAAHL